MQDLSVSQRNVVCKEVALLGVVIKEGVEPIKTVILDHEFSEPWASGDILKATAVAKCTHLNHFC